MEGVTQILMLLSQHATTVSLLVIILYGGYKKLWVWGDQLNDMRIERDQWRDLALRSTNLANRATEVMGNVFSK